MTATLSALREALAAARTANAEAARLSAAYRRNPTVKTAAAFAAAYERAEQANDAAAALTNR